MLITGMTGTGKSYLACALAHQACRKGFRALYRRASRLFDELKLARADGTYPRLLAKLARVDVLIIDDFAVAPVTDAQRGDLLEILEDRYGSASCEKAMEGYIDATNDEQGRSSGPKSADEILASVAPFCAPADADS